MIFCFLFVALELLVPVQALPTNPDQSLKRLSQNYGTANLDSRSVNFDSTANASLFTLANGAARLANGTMRLTQMANSSAWRGSAHVTLNSIPWRFELEVESNYNTSGPCGYFGFHLVGSSPPTYYQNNSIDAPGGTYTWWALCPNGDIWQTNLTSGTMLTSPTALVTTIACSKCSAMFDASGHVRFKLVFQSDLLGVVNVAMKKLDDPYNTRSAECFHQFFSLYPSRISIVGLNGQAGDVKINSFYYWELQYSSPGPYSFSLARPPQHPVTNLTNISFDYATTTIASTWNRDGAARFGEYGNTTLPLDVLLLAEKTQGSYGRFTTPTRLPQNASTLRVEVMVAVDLSSGSGAIQDGAEFYVAIHHHYATPKLELNLANSEGLVVGVSIKKDIYSIWRAYPFVYWTGASVVTAPMNASLVPPCGSCVFNSYESVSYPFVFIIEIYNDLLTVTHDHLLADSIQSICWDETPIPGFTSMIATGNSSITVGGLINDACNCINMGVEQLQVFTMQAPTTLSVPTTTVTPAPLNTTTTPDILMMPLPVLVSGYTLDQNMSNIQLTSRTTNVIKNTTSFAKDLDSHWRFEMEVETYYNTTPGICGYLGTIFGTTGSVFNNDGSFTSAPGAYIWWQLCPSGRAVYSYFSSAATYTSPLAHQYATNSCTTNPVASLPASGYARFKVAVQHTKQQYSGGATNVAFRLLSDPTQPETFHQFQQMDINDWYADTVTIVGLLGTRGDVKIRQLYMWTLTPTPSNTYSTLVARPPSYSMTLLPNVSFTAASSAIETSWVKDGPVVYTTTDFLVPVMQLGTKYEDSAAQLISPGRIPPTATNVRIEVMFRLYKTSGYGSNGNTNLKVTLQHANHLQPAGTWDDFEGIQVLINQPASIQHQQSLIYAPTLGNDDWLFPCQNCQFIIDKWLHYHASVILEFINGTLTATFEAFPLTNSSQQAVCFQHYPTPSIPSLIASGNAVVSVSLLNWDACNCTKAGVEYLRVYEISPATATTAQTSSTSTTTTTTTSTSSSTTSTTTSTPTPTSTSSTTTTTTTKTTTTITPTTTTTTTTTPPTTTITTSTTTSPTTTTITTIPPTTTTTTTTTTSPKTTTTTKTTSTTTPTTSTATSTTTIHTSTPTTTTWSTTAHASTSTASTTPTSTLSTTDSSTSPSSTETTTTSSPSTSSSSSSPATTSISSASSSALTFTTTLRPRENTSDYEFAETQVNLIEKQIQATYSEESDNNYAVAPLTIKTGFPIPALSTSDNFIPTVKTEDMTPCQALSTRNRSPRNDTKIFVTLSLEHMIDSDDVDRTVTLWSSVLLQWKVDNCPKEKVAPFVDKKESVYAGSRAVFWKPATIFLNGTEDMSMQRSDMADVMHVLYLPTEPNRTLYFYWNRVGELKAKCAYAMSTYPFDSLKCDFTFGLSEPLRLVTFAGLYLSVATKSMNDNEKWMLTNHTGRLFAGPSLVYTNEWSSYVKVSLQFRRNSLYYIANLLSPSLVLMALIFGSFVAPADIDRAAFSATILLSVMVTQTIILQATPTTADPILFADYIQLLTGLGGFITVYHLLVCGVPEHLGQRLLECSWPGLGPILSKWTTLGALDFSAFLMAVVFFMTFNIWASMVAF